jgi:transposase InsO family protein
MPTLNAFRAPVYVLVIMELTSRRLLYVNVTSHPTTDWVLQQLRQALPQVHPYRFLIHDRDSIFSAAFRHALAGFGVKSVRTPRKTPTANAHCERLVGSIRRECLDYVIALDEGHLQRILREWMRHYNLGRPHSSLGPGLPDPSAHVAPPVPLSRHSLPEGYGVTSSRVLGGLHHEYRPEKLAA